MKLTPYELNQLREYMKSRTVTLASGCVEWTGPRNGKGYGQTVTFGAASDVPRGAHRLALFLANGGRLTDGLLVCHRCDNPPCCNPAHLYEGTPKQNGRDRAERGGPAVKRKKVRGTLDIRAATPADCRRILARWQADCEWLTQGRVSAAA